MTKILQDMCRLCASLAKDEMLTFMNLLENQRYTPIMNKICDMLNIELNEDLKLHSKICDRCYFEIESFGSFVHRCRSIQPYFQLFSGKSYKEKDENKNKDEKDSATPLKNNRNASTSDSGNISVNSDNNADANSDIVRRSNLSETFSKTTRISNLSEVEKSLNNMKLNIPTLPDSNTGSFKTITSTSIEISHLSSETKKLNTRHVENCQLLNSSATKLISLPLQHIENSLPASGPSVDLLSRKNKAQLIRLKPPEKLCDLNILSENTSKVYSQGLKSCESDSYLYPDSLIDLSHVRNDRFTGATQVTIAPVPSTRQNLFVQSASSAKITQHTETQLPLLEQQCEIDNDENTSEVLPLSLKRKRKTKQKPTSVSKDTSISVSKNISVSVSKDTPVSILLNKSFSRVTDTTKCDTKKIVTNSDVILISDTDSDEEPTYQDVSKETKNGNVTTSDTGPKSNNKGRSRKTRSSVLQHSSTIQEQPRRHSSSSSVASQPTMSNRDQHKKLTPSSVTHLQQDDVDTGNRLEKRKLPNLNYAEDSDSSCNESTKNISQKSLKHCCPYCDKKMTNAGNLKRHIATHSQSAARKDVQNSFNEDNEAPVAATSKAVKSSTHVNPWQRKEKLAIYKFYKEYVNSRQKPPKQKARDCIMEHFDELSTRDENDIHKYVIDSFFS